MKCPLLVRIREPDYSHKVVYPANCLGEKCAWWDDKPGHCIFLTIGGCLEFIMAYLSEIMKKMPHEEQFRK